MNSKMRKSVTLLVLQFVFVCVCTAAPDAAQFRFKVPASKRVFGVTTSPVGASVFLFSAGQSESEELSSGIPAVIDMVNFKVHRFPKLESLEVDSISVWKKDGEHVFFETPAGIVETATSQVAANPTTVVAGKTHGIALSSDESKIAFWKMEDSSLRLVVREVKGPKVLKEWKLPFIYGGEASGFEIAFQSERTLYARTFDHKGRTPLESFDMVTGQIKTVEADCFALATGSSGIYYIANSGTVRALKKITSGKTITIPLSVRYDDLRASAGGRWLVLMGRGKSAVLDSGSDQVTIESNCESMSALSDGTPVYIRNGTLSSDKTICDSHSTNKTRGPKRIE